MLKYLAIIFLVALTSCTSTEPVTSNSSKNKSDPGSIITGRDKQGITLNDLSGTSKNKSIGIPVNALLWRASLDIASILPIDDIDVFSGTLLTDWYSLPSKPNEQIKLAIFVLDQELRSDAIRVIVYIQTLNNGVWEDTGIDQELAIQLEDLILTRAREIRASSNTK